MSKANQKRTILVLCLWIMSLLSLGCGSAGEERDWLLTIDTHVDTPFNLLLNPDLDLGERNDPDATGSQVDFPRMREGGLDAAFFAVFVVQGERTETGYSNARELATSLLDIIDQNLERHSGLAGLALDEEDLRRLEREGKRAVFVGIENGHAIGRDLSLITTYYDRGARYMTLSHVANNEICDSSTDEPEHGGLSDFGVEVVQEMNRLGMMVDVSHVSDQAFYDVLEVTSAPVIASHSSARALFDHPRNLSDDMLLAISANGGVVHMNFMSDYLKPEGVLADVDDVVDHIDHMVAVAGIDHVGIGTDFDGGGGGSGCMDVSQLPAVMNELKERAYSEEEIEKIWGGNLLRVLNRVPEKAY